MQEKLIMLKDFYGIEIYHFDKVLTPDAWDFPKTPHSHDYFELSVHIKGELDIFAEENLYHLCGGEIRIYSSGELHCGIVRKKETAEWYQIKIPTEFMNFSDGEKLLHIFLDRKFGEGNVICSEHYEDIVAILKNIYAFSDADGFLWEDYCKSQVIVLLCLLNHTENNKKAESDRNSALQKILNLIYSDYCDLMTVGDIAKRSHFSVSYINKLFREKLCISPYQFLLSKKFNEAKKALKEGKSVTEACQSAGFQDYSNFITMFRKRYGITPNRYV
ncbi:MAG: helix-turn-helix transcriptional regulator [Clostridia bacterium]|nr:helix-turn-helix transcriptional regulator [Clostridia bacterium]